MSGGQISVAERVLGVADRSDPAAFTAAAYENLLGRPYSAEQAGALLAEDYNTIVDPTRREEYLDLRALGEIAAGWITMSHPLGDWAAYARLIDRYGHPRQESDSDDTDRSALMLGAASSLSAVSGICLAEDVFGATRVTVLDLESGDDKRRQGDFVQGNVFDMSELIAADSQDVVFTSQLLAALQSPDRRFRWRRQMHRAFFGQIARVLRPGGELVMQEVVPGVTPQMSSERMKLLADATSRLLTKRLREQFGDVHVDYHIGIRDVDALFDPERNFDAYPQFESFSTLDIYARSNK